MRSRVNINSEVDTPQKRPLFRKCGKLHGRECLMGLTLVTVVENQVT